MIGRDVQEEYEANEFVHYLLKKPFLYRVKDFASKNGKWIVIGAMIIVLTGGGVVVAIKYHDWKLYEDTYYVTEQGEKYHLKNCMT